MKQKKQISLKTELKISIILFFCLSLVFVIYTHEANEISRKNTCIQHCLENIESSLNGVVIKTLEENHNEGKVFHCITVKLNNGDTINYSSRGINHSQLEYIRLRDSIIKEKNYLVHHIFRNGEKIWTIKGSCYDCEIICTKGQRYCKHEFRD
jgi:hypothetical protein